LEAFEAALKGAPRVLLVEKKTIHTEALGECLTDIAEAIHDKYVNTDKKHKKLGRVTASIMRKG
jgi:hypothetical protein